MTPHDAFRWMMTALLAMCFLFYIIFCGGCYEQGSLSARNQSAGKVQEVLSRKGLQQVSPSGIRLSMHKGNADGQRVEQSQKLVREGGNKILGGWKKEKRKVLKTFYCGFGCKESICGGNAQCASGSSSASAGVASDPRRIPYHSLILFGDGRMLEVDDCFGKARREKDFREGIWHIDERVIGKSHKEVLAMGKAWIDVEIWTPLNGKKNP